MFSRLHQPNSIARLLKNHIEQLEGKLVDPPALRALMAENAPQPSYSPEEVVKQRKALFLELEGDTLEAKVMRDICYNIGVRQLPII